MGGRLLGLTLVISLVPVQAAAWFVEMTGVGLGDDEATAVTLDSAEDVIVGGTISNPDLPTGDDFMVLKLAGADGSQIWRTDLDSAGTFVSEVAVDGSDDVIAMGSAVVKLSGSDGSFLWQTNELGNAVAIDPAGDPVIAITGTDFVVVRLSGSDGTEIWRYSRDGSAAGDDESVDVAVDPSGDVVAVGVVINASTGADVVAVKLDGGTGALLWEATIQGDANGDDEVHDVLVDANGDVYVAGGIVEVATGPDAFVVKLSGVNGSEIWMDHNAGPRYAPFHHLRYSPDGLILAASAELEPASDYRIALGLRKLDPETGDRVFNRFGPSAPAGIDTNPDGEVFYSGFWASDISILKRTASFSHEVWRYIADGATRSDDAIHDLVATSDGDVVAVGVLENRLIPQPFEQDIVIIKLDGEMGRLSSCGNGVLDVREVCDDGNEVDSDGCNRVCEETFVFHGFLIEGERIVVRDLHHRDPEEGRVGSRLAFAARDPRIDLPGGGVSPRLPVHICGSSIPLRARKRSSSSARAGGGRPGRGSSTRTGTAARGAAVGWSTGPVGFEHRARG